MAEAPSKTLSGKRAKIHVDAQATFSPKTRFTDLHKNGTPNAAKKAENKINRRGRCVSGDR
jgi:hypothetical protein